MKKVIVIGGRGFFGHFICENLEKADLNIFKTSSSVRDDGSIYFNFANVASYAALNDFDVVINCAECTDRAVYRRFLQYIIDQRLILLEATAVPEMIKTLLEFRSDAAKETGEGATIFVGIGIFPGLSNILCSEHHETYQAPVNTLDLIINYSVLSGAGKGMIDLMLATLYTAAKISSMGHIQHIENKASNYIFQGQRVSIIDLPELYLFNARMNLEAISTGMMFKPNVVNQMVPALRSILNYSETTRKLATTGMRFAFRVTRGLLFKTIDPSVAIKSVVNKESVHSLALGNGLNTAGLFITALTELILEDQNLPKGVLFPEEYVKLKTVLERMKRISNDFDYELDQS